MTEFIRSYRPAIRSNIARTWGSSRVPGVGWSSATGAPAGAVSVLAMIPMARLLEV
jgi:hypothetical protein